MKRGQEYQDHIWARIVKGTTFMAAAALLAILAAMMLSGCSAPRVVTVPGETRIEYRTVHDIQTDTVYRDRIQTIRTQGDTVYMRDSIYFYERVKVEVRDTIHHTDTIRVPYPEPVEVERNFTKKETFLMDTGRSVLWIIGLALLGLAIYVAIRLARKGR